MTHSDIIYFRQTKYKVDAVAFSSEGNDVEIYSDGITVWVCDKRGCTIGRFGKFGIDIHHHQEDMTECLFCTHEEVGHHDWTLFVSKMKEYYDVKIPKEFRPDRFTRYPLLGIEDPTL